MKKLLLTIVFMFVCSISHSAWTVDSLSYDNRKKITISNTNVDSDLGSFPLYVEIDGDTDIGGNTNTDGFDIRFTTTDGETLLKFEREKHVVDTGSLDASYWVKIPTVSNSGGTDIYIYYRDTDTADDSDPTNVWDANYLNVYHFMDASGNLTDSTGTTDASATDVTAYQAAGFNGGYSMDFLNSSTDSISVFQNYSFAAGLTVDAVFKADDATPAGTRRVYFSWGASATDGIYIHMGTDGTHYFGIVEGNSYATCTLDDAMTTNWNYVSGTRQADDDVVAYVDGVAQTDTENEPGTLAPGNVSYRIGSVYDNSADWWDGNIAEMRFSNKDRGVDWLKFQYENMASAGNELTYGNEEPEAGGGTGQIIIIIM